MACGVRFSSRCLTTLMLCEWRTTMKSQKSLGRNEYNKIYTLWLFPLWNFCSLDEGMSSSEVFNLSFITLPWLYPRSPGTSAFLELLNEKVVFLSPSHVRTESKKVYCKNFTMTPPHHVMSQFQEIQRPDVFVISGLMILVQVCLESE